ncbi:MAG TPA: hypothetical protein VK175_19075 [Leadbetterella sp.]|nr:hypothetical protein [Leadbetterella sp.]
MKKLFFILLIFPIIGYSQVNTLPNSIGIGQNTNTAVPLHINKPGEVARFQGASPYVTFYDALNFKGYIQVIGDHLEIGSKNNHNIDFYTNNLPQFRIDGTSGQITAFQKINANNGIRLSGPLQAENESVGPPGSVLVSKGNATPAWEDRRVYFLATFPNGIFNLNSTSTYTFTSYSEYVDLNNNFNPTTGIFTVPATGLYQFSWKFVLSNPISNPTINEVLFSFIVRLNNSDASITKYRDTNLLPNYSNLSDNSGNYTIYLNENDQIAFGITQSNNQGQVLNLFTNGSGSDIRISGHRIF